MEKIIEGNKLIAEFMGMEKERLGYNIPKSFQCQWTNCELEDFRFHTSWDWLMPVARKINGLSGEWPQTTEPLWSLSIAAPIEKVWHECVVIAKWWGERDDNFKKNNS